MIDEKLALDVAEGTKKFYFKVQKYILDIIKASGYYSSVVNGQSTILHEADFRVGAYRVEMSYLFSGVMDDVKTDKEVKVRVYTFSLSMYTPKKSIFGGETKTLLIYDYPHLYQTNEGLRIDTFRCKLHDQACFSVEHISDIQDFLINIRGTVDTSEALMAM